jgi:hypothetical protein
MDNVSNNDTFVSALEEILQSSGIDFVSDEWHIRYDNI